MGTPRGPYQGKTEYSLSHQRKLGLLKPKVIDYKKKIMDNVKIDEQTGCWIWQRCKNNLGYGFTTYHGKGNQLVHRVAYMEFIGPIPDPSVCHNCDNPSCCNPDHLWSGTQRQNTQDMISKSREGWFMSKIINC
jgi:hypothetical protein